MRWFFCLGAPYYYFSGDDMDDLRETAVQQVITTHWLGRSYRYFPSVGSTNDLLKEAADRRLSQLPAGTVFLTDYQRQGRGRLNRRWDSPAGSSLLLSVLFRPAWPAEQANWLTMLACLAGAEAVEEIAGLSVHVKWPNDLVVNVQNSWHKFGGLLLEGNLGDDGRLQSAILGIGINVNVPVDQLPETSFPATSLLAIKGRPVSRLALLQHLFQRLETRYELADSGQSPQSAWTRRMMNVNKRVGIVQADGTDEISGVVTGTDEWGQLQLRDDDGKLHTFAAGDVTLH